MSDFKVGQLVELVRTFDQGLSVEVGAIGTVEEITTDPVYPIDVTWIENGEIEAVSPNEIMIVKDGSVEEV